MKSEDDVSGWNIFWHHAGLFPGYPGSVICCLTLICRNSIIVSNISSLLLSFFSFLCSHYVHVTFCHCPTVLGYHLVSLSVFVLFAFQIWRLLFKIFSGSEMIFSAMFGLQIKPIKNIFHFCYSIFKSLSVLFGSFVGFPSFCSHYPSVLVCCLLNLLAPLTYYS